ncbi:MAG: D-alanyl-lipoteichoic acid biosynthesis protein DltB [Eubacteriales bacterium]|nr:D-alanyl-lipoteichoic acid biosynthesis protein DltB [Eubacteriales bacterium]
MSYYEGTAFFLCLGVIFLAALILGYLEKSLKWFGFVLSLLFAGVIFWNHPGEAVYLLLFLGWSEALILFYMKKRKEKGRVARTYHIILVLSLLPLILCKISPLWKGSIFGFVGISYLSFRVAQIIIEIYDGVIKEVSFVEIAAFLVFFPSFSSGPIDRSRRFLEDWNRKYTREEYLELWGKGMWKFLLGAVYKVVIAAGAYKVMGFLETGTSWYIWIAYAYAYGLYLFFDFAGYSLMAVGSSYILGIALPENFNKPFVSKDIREFWDRWHISLSHWFRDFVFTRFVMFSSKKKWFGNRLNRACVGFFVNMGIMGLWHGVSVSYILYGLYHGLLLAGTEVYQKKSKFYKRNKNKKGYQLLSWFVTMQLVMFGFFLFSGKLVALIAGL